MTKSIGFDFYAKDGISPVADKAGASVTALGRTIDAASGTVEVDADVAKAEAGVARLNAKKVRIEANIDDTMRQIRILEVELSDATEDRKLEITDNIDQLKRKLRTLEADKVSVDMDTRAAEASLSRLKTGVHDVAEETTHGGESASTFGDKMDKAGAVVGTVAGVLIGFGAVLEQSVTMGLARANAQVALGDEAFAKLDASAAQMAHGMGQTTAEFILTAGQVATLAKNLGFSSDESAKFGATLPKVADNLAMLSAGSLSSAEASDVLRSALAGEYDPLQAVGIAISGEIVNQEKANIIKQRGAEITDLQASALAVMAIVTRQTAAATDVQATSAGQQAVAIETAKANMKEMANTITAQVLPAVGSLAMTFNEGTTAMGESTGTAEKLWAAFETGNPVAATLIKNIKDKDTVTKGAMFADDAAAQEVARLAAENDKAAAAYGRLRDAAMKMADGVLSSRDAARQYQAALDDATASIKQNGTSLDITTEKGRANQAALDGIASAALRQGQAILDAGGSQKQFDSALTTSRAQLQATAERFGMTKAEAQAYVAQVLAIPASKSTTITADTSQATAAVRAIKAEIVSINGKTVTIRTVQETVYISSGSGTKIAKSMGGPVPWIPGAQAGKDTVPLMATPDEFVVRAGPATRYRRELDLINAGASPMAALTSGGSAPAMRAAGAAGGGGGDVHYHVPVTNAVLGNEAQVARVVVGILRSAQESGLLPQMPRPR